MDKQVPYSEVWMNFEEVVKGKERMHMIRTSCTETVLHPNVVLSFLETASDTLENLEEGVGNG